MGSTQCQGLSSHVNKSHMGSIEFVLIIEKKTHMGCISIPLAHVIMFPLQSLLLFLTLPPCSPKVSQSCCNYFLQISFFNFFFFFSHHQEVYNLLDLLEYDYRVETMVLAYDHMRP